MIQTRNAKNHGQTVVFARSRSGGRGIRTPDVLADMPVFKTGAISRSAIPPATRHCRAASGSSSRDSSDPGSFRQSRTDGRIHNNRNRFRRIHSVVSVAVNSSRIR